MNPIMICLLYIYNKSYNKLVRVGSGVTIPNPTRCNYLMNTR